MEKKKNSFFSQIAFMKHQNQYHHHTMNCGGREGNQLVRMLGRSFPSYALSAQARNYPVALPLIC